MRRVAVVLLVLVSSWSISAQDAPTFRARTTLIEFTFVAHDGNGRPITDLKPDEIELREDGNARDVAFFRFEGAPANSVGPRGLTAGLFTNRIEYSPGPPRNITVVLIDALNTPPTDQQAVRRQLTMYLNTVAADTRIAVYGLSSAGVVVLHDFSDDVASLRNGMDDGWKKFPVQAMPDVQEVQCYVGKFLGWPADVTTCQLPRTPLDWELFGAETLAFQAAAERRRNTTLAVLGAIGDQLAGIPGRKSLVWIGRGFSSASITGAYGAGNYGGRTSYADQIKRTAERLASQGVVMYPVDSRAMLPGTSPSRPMRSSRSTTGRGQRGSLFIDEQQNPDALVSTQDRIMAGFVSSHDPWPTMDVMAAVTGGRVIKLTNDTAAGVAAAANDTRGAYTVGFYTAGEPDGSWHQLDVKVRRRGVKVVHRQGYLATDVAPQPAVWTEERWRQVISNPIGSTLVRLDGRCERLDGDAVSLIVQMMPEDLHVREVEGRLQAEVEIAVAERMPDGDTAFSVTATTIVLTDSPADRAASMVRFSKRLTLRANTSAIMVIVRDRFTSRYGTLEIPVARIPAAAVGTNK